MIEDPPRLLSNDSDAEALERDLLGSLRRVSVPADAKSAVWQSIVAAGAAGAGVTAVTAIGATASAAASSSAGVFGSFSLGKSALTTKLAAKLAIALAGAGASGSGVYWLYQQRNVSSTAMPTPSPSAAAPARAPTPSPAAPVAPPPPSAAAPVSEAPAAPRVRPAITRKTNAISKPSALAVESALLEEARSRLRSGDSASAERLLHRLQRRFANGVLQQEREVLSVELLQARGETDAAERAARAFVAAYPNSPHSVTLRKLIHEPQ